MARYFMFKQYLLFSLITLIYLNSISQVHTVLNNTSHSTQLAIHAAKLAEQSHFYSKDSYFNKSSRIARKNVDTAVYYIIESINALDSSMLVAADSQFIAIQHVKIARKFAVLSYKSLIRFQKSVDPIEKKELSEEATFYTAQVISDSYFASLYFSDGKKPEQTILQSSQESQQVDSTQKLITKLDIDQTLFTLLTAELLEKIEANKKEIERLNNELQIEKELNKQNSIKNQLKNLSQKDAELTKKNQDALSKLTTINTQIAERDKVKIAAKAEETVFTKKTIKNNNNWNKEIQLDSELPDGLIYQVQLGVYKKNVLPEVFKGLNPIYGKTTEKGISYSTGLFEKYADAKEARAYIIKMGLVDAFIVAYYNKKKLSPYGAQKLEKK